MAARRSHRIKNRKFANRPSAVFNAVYSSSRSVLVIDDAEIRKSAFNKAQKKIIAIEKLEAKIKDFQDVELSLYQNWYQLTFEKLNQYHERCRTKLRELSTFHNQIVAEHLMNNISMGEAFQRVLEEKEKYGSLGVEERQNIDQARKQRARFEEQHFDDFDDSDDLEDWDADDGEGLKDMLDDLFDQLNESLFSEAEGETKKLHDKKRFAELESQAIAENAILESTKLLYRKLVRKLHPDTFVNAEGRKDPPPWLENVWQQTQAAYVAMDLVALEKLWALTLLRLNQWNDLSISDVHSIEQTFSVELKNLKSQERQLKKSPAWGFSKASGLGELERKISLEIRHEIRLFEEESERIESYHQMLAMEKHRRRHKRDGGSSRRRRLPNNHSRF